MQTSYGKSNVAYLIEQSVLDRVVLRCTLVVL